MEIINDLPFGSFPINNIISLVLNNSLPHSRRSNPNVSLKYGRRTLCESGEFDLGKVGHALGF